MTGRFNKRGDNLDITVELVEYANNKSLWGEQYERKMSDLLATHERLPTPITQKLQLQLAGTESGIAKKYTSSNEAYQLYLKGRFHWAKRTKDDLFKSIELISRRLRSIEICSGLRGHCLCIQFDGARIRMPRRRNRFVCQSGGSTRIGARSITG